MGQSSSTPVNPPVRPVTMPAITTPESCPLPAQSAAPAAEKPKPCCVCKDEKARRDECMLFSKAADPAKDCQSTILAYRACMEGYGFKI